MNILAELKDRFATALSQVADDSIDELLDMIRPSQDPKFGDYQANCAMPLGKRLGTAPREVAAAIVERLQVDDICEPPGIAGPGFINLKLRDDWLVEQLNGLVSDPRLGIPEVTPAKTYVVDYSSPNVAKPMHVGHIRSTVIGDALCRTLRFLGHRVISDNHLGDWGTQFGMIIYGYKHFVDRAAYEANPLPELGRLYKLVNQLVEYHDGKARLPEMESQLADRQSEVERQRAELKDGDKKGAKALRKLEVNLKEAADELARMREKLAAVDQDDRLAAWAAEHPDIAEQRLRETARLHAGDAENRQLWEEFLPKCRQEIQHIYDRLEISFDVEYGESFYHDQLAAVVADLGQRGLAKESDGAICVFLDDFDAPMIVRKRDGAFLYATTDLATIQFRMKEWQPNAILYVVDHRQGEHFDKLFAVADVWGYENVEFRHVSFGTVLGKDRKPYKTRSGDTVGLEGLLDDAVARAHHVVCSNDDARPGGRELSDEDRRHVADVVGHAAIKYADLSHNRTSDYEFSVDKMVAMEGNTATYMQYSYARVQSIFRRGEIDIDGLRSGGGAVTIDHPNERTIALELLRFGDALNDAVADYRPNQLTAYLYTLANEFARFFDRCHVLKADDEATRTSRLLLCDLAGRTIKTGLGLLGIGVVDKM